MFTTRLSFLPNHHPKTLDVKIPSVSFYANRLLEELDGENEVAGGGAEEAESPVADPGGVGERVAN